MNIADSQELQMDAKGRVRRSFSPVRLIGNLLIISGLALLLGIGGWQGYNWWNNQQFLQNAKSSGVLVEPTLSVAQQSDAPVPTATAVSQPPPPDLHNPAGIGIVPWLSVLDRPTYDSPPVRLIIPSVKIDTKIVPITWAMLPGKNGAAAQSEWQVADNAVGHHQGTANPGQTGNVVLSGHVDYRGEVFRDLKDVKKGDTVTVDTADGQYVYIVTDLVLVKEEGVSDAQKRANAAYMNRTPDQTLTMITCWPYGIDDHRLIVIAKPYQSSQSANSEFFMR
ncbi:MAG: sortase [Chloroflexia bacterium]